MAVVAPMPRARVRIVANVNPGDLARERKAKRNKCMGKQVCLLRTPLRRKGYRKNHHASARRYVLTAPVFSPNGPVNPELCRMRAADCTRGGKTWKWIVYSVRHAT